MIEMPFCSILRKGKGLPEQFSKLPHQLKLFPFPQINSGDTARMPIEAPMPPDTIFARDWRIKVTGESESKCPDIAGMFRRLHEAVNQVQSTSAAT